MKRAECDQCKTLVDAADMIYGTPPKGWLQVGTQGNYPGKDFCSINCAIAYLIKTAAAMKEVTQEATPA